jgi:hypothetical protein
VQPASSMAAATSAARGLERRMGPEHTVSAAVGDDYDLGAVREERAQPHQQQQPELRPPSRGRHMLAHGNLVAHGLDSASASF